MQLREILAAFEAGKPLSLAQMSHQFGVEQSALEGMLDFWVRKGRLRETTYTSCADCGLNHACPAAMSLPRRYELLTGDETPLSVCACYAQTE